MQRIYPTRSTIYCEKEEIAAAVVDMIQHIPVEDPNNCATCADRPCENKIAAVGEGSRTEQDSE